MDGMGIGWFDRGLNQKSLKNHRLDKTFLVEEVGHP